MQCISWGAAMVRICECCQTQSAARKPNRKPNRASDSVGTSLAALPLDRNTSGTARTTLVARAWTARQFSEIKCEQITMCAKPSSSKLPNYPNEKHSAFTSLPVVDISGLFSSDLATRKSAAKSLDKAAREAGFLFITGHGIPGSVISTLKRCAQDYFAQPDDIKKQNYIGSAGNHSGYVPMGEEQFYGGAEKKAADAKEAFDVVYEIANPGPLNVMQGVMQWPELPGFKAGVKAYFDQVLNLSEVLFRGFALGLGLDEEVFTRDLHAPASQLRLIHYFDSSDSPDEQQGIGAHTDYEFFTILLPTSPGLQVLNGAGEWIDVPVLPDAFVVNIGDMMEIFTNGNYVATSHRVKRLTHERYSFPLFCSLDFETLVEPHPQLCSDTPPRYEPLVCGEHLLAQTMQTFNYLKKKIARGELALPEKSRSLSSFGKLAAAESKANAADSHAMKKSGANNAH